MSASSVHSLIKDHRRPRCYVRLLPRSPGHGAPRLAAEPRQPKAVPEGWFGPPRPPGRRLATTTPLDLQVRFAGAWPAWSQLAADQKGPQVSYHSRFFSQWPQTCGPFGFGSGSKRKRVSEVGVRCEGGRERREVVGGGPQERVARRLPCVPSYARACNPGHCKEGCMEAPLQDHCTRRRAG